MIQLMEIIGTLLKDAEQITGFTLIYYMDYIFVNIEYNTN